MSVLYAVYRERAESHGFRQKNASLRAHTCVRRSRVARMTCAAVGAGVKMPRSLPFREIAPQPSFIVDSCVGRS